MERAQRPVCYWEQLWAKMVLSTVLNGSGDLTQRRKLMLEKPRSAKWKIHRNDVINFQNKAAFKVSGSFKSGATERP